jgi:hypothetical protein
VASPEFGAPALRDFQAWMQTFIVTSGTPQEALQAAEQAAGLPGGSAQRLVKPSPTLDEMERLMIYRRMYPLRMEEALSLDFPVCRAILGRPRFRELVECYVEAYPSRSWTLDHLGQHMLPFLESHPWGREVAGLLDMARLEQAVCEVCGAQDAPVLTPQGLAQMAPEDWFDACLACIPALRLLDLESNADELYKAHNAERSLPEVELRPTFLVVWRQELQTWRMPLQKAAYETLRRLQEGVPLGDALGQACQRFALEHEQLFDWFNTWVSEGFFQALQGFERAPGVPTPPNQHPIPSNDNKEIT